MTTKNTASAPRRSLFQRWKESYLRTPRLWWTRLIYSLTPIMGLFMVELMNEKNPFTNLNFQELVMNLIWYVLLLFLLWLLFGKRRRSATVYLLLLFGAGMVNHFVLAYRGRILLPQDVTSWRTAANVAAEYDLSPDVYVWGAAALLLLWLLLIRFVMQPQGGREYFAQKRTTVITALLAAAYIFVFFFTPALPAAGVKAELWKTQSNGFLLNFSLALRYSRVKRPDGYSAQAVEELSRQLASEGGGEAMKLYSAPYIASPYEKATSDADGTPRELLTLTGTETGVQPVNIVCIMDESFADLAIFDTISMNKDSVPFYHSLKKNTIKGWMYSPVTGAGTANVEYEYLTGNSVSFLPDETTAYELYVRPEMPSLVSWARELGYHTTTIHPYFSTGWNRVQVYGHFGVDDQLYNEDFYPADYVRGYISDQCDFEKLREITSAEEGDKQFIFNVTMQNHGGYRQGWYNLRRRIWLTGRLYGCSEYTEQYLNLMRETDDQVKRLLSYYKKQKEPTMVVFFGDHQGKLSSWFYEYKLYQKDLDLRTLEELEKMYVTPFFVWTNYDSPSAQDVMLSTNFLSALTAKCANLPTSAYQDYLCRVSAELPVVQTVGYIDREGKLTDDPDQLTPEQQKLLSDYETLSFYNLFGSKKQRIPEVDKSFFTPRGQAPLSENAAAPEASVSAEASED